MEFAQSFILGLLQGLTEFLPVSSSGHLVILQSFMGLDDAAKNISYDIFLHIATLLAVSWAYRKDLGYIFASDVVGEGDGAIPKWRLLGFLLISIVATGIVLPFKDGLEAMFESVKGVRVLMIINGAALGILPMLRKGQASLISLSWLGAAIIGLAQAVGAFPGISRSGSTIIAGLLLGLSPREACKYSFLLSIPTVILAALFQIPDAMTLGLAFEIGPAMTGFAIAFIIGLGSIPLLIGIVEKGRLWGFAIYCAFIGIGLFFV